MIKMREVYKQMWWPFKWIILAQALAFSAAIVCSQLMEVEVELIGTLGVGLYFTIAGSYGMTKTYSMKSK